MRLTAARGALWAIFAALLGLAGLRLLAACDLGQPPLFSLGLKYCPAPVDYAALKGAGDSRRELEGLIHDNELKIAKAPNCAPPEPAPASTPSPPAPEPTHDSLRIPTVLKDLKGCWVSDRGDIEITEVRTRRHIGNARFCYCFGEDGRGTLKFKKLTGQTCEGPISAKLKNDGLVIDQPSIPCSPSRYIDYIMTCRPDGSGSAVCTKISREYPERPTDPESYHRAEGSLCD